MAYTYVHTQWQEHTDMYTYTHLVARAYTYVHIWHTQWQEHCTGIARGVCLIPAGGPIVDEFFSTVPGLNLDMCTIFHSN